MTNRNKQAEKVAHDEEFDYRQHKDDPVAQEPGMPGEVLFFSFPWFAF